MAVRLHVSGDALRALAATPEALRDAFVAWQRRAAPYVQASMARVIRGKQRTFGRTGQLSGSIRVRSLGRGGFDVGPTVGYAPFVQWPTRAHEIRPRYAQALTIPLGGGVLETRLGMTRGGQAFTVARVGGRERRVTMGGQGVRFARRVMHPGTRGMFFLEATRDEVRDPVAAMLEDEVSMQLAGLALRSVHGVGA